MVIVKPIDACPDFHPLVLNEYPLEGSAQRHAFARLVQETALGVSGIGGKGAIEPPTKDCRSLNKLFASVQQRP
jgi:hypothetical protein